MAARKTVACTCQCIPASLQSCYGAHVQASGCDLHPVGEAGQSLSLAQVQLAQHMVEQLLQEASENSSGRLFGRTSDISTNAVSSLRDMYSSLLTWPVLLNLKRYLGYVMDFNNLLLRQPIPSNSMALPQEGIPMALVKHVLSTPALPIDLALAALAIPGMDGQVISGLKRDVLVEESKACINLLVVGASSAIFQDHLVYAAMQETDSAECLMKSVQLSKRQYAQLVRQEALQVCGTTFNFKAMIAEFVSSMLLKAVSDFGMDIQVIVWLHSALIVQSTGQEGER